MASDQTLHTNAVGITWSSWWTNSATKGGLEGATRATRRPSFVSLLRDRRMPFFLLCCFFSVAFSLSSHQSLNNIDSVPALGWAVFGVLGIQR